MSRWRDSNAFLRKKQLQPIVDYCGPKERKICRPCKALCQNCWAYQYLWYENIHSSEAEQKDTVRDPLEIHLQTLSQYLATGGHMGGL